MGNVTLFKGGVPSYLQTMELDETTKALMGGGGGSKRISIRGGVFRMIVDGEEVAKNEDRSMNVVIVKAQPKVGRTYYEGTYVEGGETKPPACWSNDGVTPDASVKSPQSPQCATCPQNIKGSGQGDARACRFSQRIAVVLENDLSGNVYQVSLPAKSLFGKGDPNDKMPMHAYVKYLAGHRALVIAVVTEMRFDTSEAVPVLKFRPLRELTEDEFNICREQAASPDAEAAVAMTVYQADTAGGKSNVAFVGGVQAESNPAPEGEGPTKRPAKAPEQVTPKKDVGKLIDAWADDDDS